MKKLVLCNIVMLLIALVGAVSLLVAPVISLNMGKAANGMIEAEESSEESDEDLSAGAEQLKILTSVLDTDISVTTVKLGKIATAKNSGAAFLTEFLLYRGGPIENVLLGSVVSGSVVSAAALSDAQIKNIDYHELREILYELEAEDADVDEIVGRYINTLKEQVGAEAFENFDEAQIKRTIVDGVNNVKDSLGGNFSAEALVCIALTGGKEGGPITYQDLAEALTAGDVELEGGSGGDAFAVIAQTVGTMAEYGSYIGYAFYGMLAFLLPWALFILLCLLHIFISNKRCATWYLFLFGWLPCGIFWLVPTIAKLLLPKLLGSLGATVAAILGALGSYAWISGLCLVVMWLVWLVWMRPLKKEDRVIE